MPNDDETMRLSADALCGERGGEPVFSGLSFTLAQGEALALTGPNGAGKSTLLRVLCGLLPAAAGTVRLTGAGPFADAADACHYLGHRNAMKTALSVEENLSFWRDFLGHPRLSPARALAAVGLEAVAQLPFAYLSTGQRRRAAIARLLVAHRPVWLLDEPASGLDGASEERFTTLMRAHLDEGGLIVAATHRPLGLEGAGELKMGGT